MSIKNFIQGTAIKIIVFLSESNPDLVTITIEDPSEVEKVSAVNMTSQSDDIYYYIWQSSEDDDEGTYRITVRAVYGNYTSISQSFLELTSID